MDVRQDPVGHQLEGQSVPEKPADIDGDDVDQVIQLIGVALQAGKIGAEIFASGGRKPLADATFQHVRMVAREIKAPFFEQVVEDG